MDTLPFFRLFQSTLSLYATTFRSASVFVFLSLLILQACGGGGSTPPVDQNPGDPKTISGTAAAGAPIVGIVSVKGANGATASAPIELDGSYSINVDALTEPYILFASGSVNDKSVEYYSSGVTGVINITHLTDYIIRNAN